MVGSRLTAYQVTGVRAKTIAMQVGFDENRIGQSRRPLLVAPADAAGMQNMSRPTLLIVFLDRPDTAGYTWDHLAIDSQIARLLGTGADPIERGPADSIFRLELCPRYLLDCPAIGRTTPGFVRGMLCSQAVLVGRAQIL